MICNGTTALLPLVAILVLIVPVATRAQTYEFSGGPQGGTFQYFASAIATLSDRVDLRIDIIPSGGALENIQMVSSGRSDFGITYAGHIIESGCASQSSTDETLDGQWKYQDVRVVAVLYGAPAQLVVREDSGIKDPRDLAGKKVGVGNIGSGAARCAEVFFTQLAIWDRIDREFIGYRDASKALTQGALDAFWVLVGYPNISVTEAALQSDIVLLNTYESGASAGLFDVYPHLERAAIPAGTYRGQVEEVVTFQDVAVWVAHKSVSEEDVYELLKVIYGDDGLKYMASVHQSAREMTVEDALKNVVTPIHPGAERFFGEKGVLETKPH